MFLAAMLGLRQIIPPILVTTAALLTGCGPKYVRLAENRPAYTREEGRNQMEDMVGSREIDVAYLRAVADAYLGTPYLLGGNGPDSIDCSAFTQQVLRKSYGLELPRKASWQSELGVHVFQFGLQKGDLVFFGPAPDTIEHVGIYMGDGEFINATSSQGVKYSNLDEKYWADRYQFAKRVIINMSPLIEPPMVDSSFSGMSVGEP